MAIVILNIATSLAATFIYSLISKYFLINKNNSEKETDNIVKIVNIIVSLLIYISTLIFLFILSPILTGRWDDITDAGMFNVIKASVGPLMFISMGAIFLAAFSMLVIMLGKSIQLSKRNQTEAYSLIQHKIDSKIEQSNTEENSKLD